MASVSTLSFLKSRLFKVKFHFGHKVLYLKLRLFFKSRFIKLRPYCNRLASRFYFQRRHGVQNRLLYNKMQLLEPEGVPQNLTFDIWIKKSFNSCVLDHDPECVYKVGSLRDYSVAYFCGQDDKCREFGSAFALRKAKENIDKFYPMVAVLERLKDSIKLAEYLFPNFFTDASQIYQDIPS